MAKQVTIELNTETAAISVDRTGFQGQGCDAVTKAFENLGEVTLDKKKPEYKQKSINLQRK
jgi:hypothetical protein